MTTSTSGPAAGTTGDSNGQHGPATMSGASTAVAPAAPPTTAAPGRPDEAPTLASAPPIAEPVTETVTRPQPGPSHAPSQPDRSLPAGGQGRQAGSQPHLPQQPRQPTPPKKSKLGRLLLLFPILLAILAVAGWLGYRYWYDSTYFISTDNATITGDLVQVGSLNAGRVVATRVDVGRTVQAGQEIAVVAMPQEVGSTAQGAGPKMSVTGNTDTLVPVYAPLTGVVAARLGYIGGTVAAGQPIYALVDPAQVWVKANIEESSAWRVALGQTVDIHVDALNRDFTGRVDAITPASAATFSLLPSSNASGNFTKVTQYVPIKIVVDAGGTVLPLGTSVEVKIHVREPGLGVADAVAAVMLGQDNAWRP